MKKKSLWAVTAALAAGILSLGTDVSLQAAEPETVVETEAEETKGSETEASKIQENEKQDKNGEYFGVWRYIWYDNTDYALSNDLMFMPDRTIFLADVPEAIQVGTYELSGGKFTMENLPEEVAAQANSITGEFTPLVKSDAATYKLKSEDADLYFQNEEEDNKLVMTVDATDETDPLAPKSIQATTAFLKLKNQDLFLNKLLQDTAWDIDGKVLVISSDGTLNLDDGAQTGKFTVSSNEIKFAWDKGAAVTYMPEEITEDSIILSNLEDDSQIITLTRNADISMPEADTEAETE